MTETLSKCDWCFKKRKSKLVKFIDGFSRALCFECMRTTYKKDNIRYLKGHDKAEEERVR